MKRTLNKVIRGERGQALIIVLILLLLGGLITAPLLGFMSTGLIAGQVFEVKMEGLYAADAGIEKACWKLLNGETPNVGIPFCDFTDVNGMHVVVIPLGKRVDGDGTYYTLQSTACLIGETEPKAEIIAQVLVAGGTVAEGGEGGEYKTNEDMAALSVIDEFTIIFSTQNKSEFWGREDDPSQPGTEIEPEDLALLNIATGTGALYLDGDALGLLGSPKYEFNSVHYYKDASIDYLLMSIKTNADVGATPFTSSDIIRLEVEVNEDNPAHPFIQSASVDTLPFHTIPGATISALTRRVVGATEIILFSFSNPSVTLDGTEFYKGEVIAYDLSTGKYSLLFNVNDIIPDNPAHLEIDCLAIILPEPDQRLLLSFTVDPVTDSDGLDIKSQDVAIWDPGPDGLPNTDDDTINLHISMSEETTVIGGGITVDIISWEISE